MQKNHNIRKLLGSLFLLLFVISITPKKYWHDAFAKHTDSFPFASKSAGLVFHKAGIYCDWQMPVTTSPFTETEEIILAAPLPVITCRPEAPVVSVFSASISQRSLRGPPAIS